MTTQEALMAARDLISTPDKWTQGYTARNAEAEGCDPNDADACQWCAQGAVVRVAGFNETGAIRQLDSCAMDMGWGESPDGESPSANLNDHETHSEMLAMFDCAIRATA